MKRSSMIKGYIFIIASAVIFGCMPLMANGIYAEGVTPLSLVFFRNALSVPVLMVLSLRYQGNLKIPGKVVPSMIVTALMGCCVTPMLLFSSYRFIPSGTATVFHFVYPAVVVLAGILFLRQKIRIGTLISVAVCVVGICLFYDPGQPLNWQGSLLALFSGVTYSVYILLLPPFREKGVTGFRFSFYTAAFCAAATLMICLVSGQLAFPTTLSGWGLCLLFALAVNVGAVVLFQQGTFLIGGQRASILSTMEPVTGVLVGALVFRETISFQTATGAVLVIAASILIAVFDSKTSK